MQKGSFELMKKLNQRNIMRLIYKEKGISRARIARETGLSPATVSNIVSELLAGKLVRETSRGESTGGRKPVILRVNSDGAYFMGLEWGITDFRGVLVDLSGNIVREYQFPVQEYTTDFFIDKTVSLVGEMGEEISSREKIFGIGIGLHGPVNPERGLSLFTPHFAWGQINIKKMLTQKIDLEIFVDNDVRMMARSEKAAGREDFILINTGAGIGAALVLEGSMRYGKDWTAGELGHMSIVENGPTCSCGRQGCLEALISRDRLLEKYHDSTDIDRLSQRRKNDLWQEFVSGVKKGEDRAREILRQGGVLFGQGIANIINLLNPADIIITGSLLEVKEYIFPLIDKQIREKALKIPGLTVKVKAAERGKLSGAYGAAILLQEKFFEFGKENAGK